jgi:ABC-type polysaccharide/polyol phosphate export permease
MTPTDTTDATVERSLSTQRHVHEPHRIGLPPLGPYLHALWQRREFAFELARTKLRSQNYDTVFGQLWLVLNPVLLAGVYFVLVDIIRHGHHPPHFFARLMAALFAYHFVSDAIRQGAKSVVQGGKLILNTAFPRLLLPLSSVITGFIRFMPTLLIYAVVHLLSGLPVGLVTLWVIPLIALFTLLATGLSILVAAAQVYFRDLSSFLPYLLRVWMYVSPVLWSAAEVPHGYKWLLKANPIAPLLDAWNQVLHFGRPPTWHELALGAAWSVVFLVIGSVFFMSREREFAVRL